MGHGGNHEETLWRPWTRGGDGGKDADRKKMKKVPLRFRVAGVSNYRDGGGGKTSRKNLRNKRRLGLREHS